jgi:hypothetical protein
MVSDPRLRLDDLVEHLDRIEGDELYLGEYRVMTSSGSSGRKAVFVYDRAGWRGVLTMFLRRSEWNGARPRLPRLRLLLSLSVTQPLPKLVARLNGFQPNHMNAYPSAMALLAPGSSASTPSSGPTRREPKG